MSLAPSGASSRRAAPRAPLAAYVLHRHDWSETSVVVELFTRDLGRVAVVAKGARRPTSNLRPVLLPFHPLLVSFTRPGGDDQAELHTLRGAEWVGGTALLPAAQMLSAYYANELLLRLLARQDPHPRLYDAYAALLQDLALAAEAADEAPALRAFELRLLRECGLLPELAGPTLAGAALHETTRYALRPEGLVEADAGPPGSAWVALEAALQHGSATALRQAAGAGGAALRPQLRDLLHYHLGPSPLRTRLVRDGLQQLAPARTR